MLSNDLTEPFWTFCQVLSSFGAKKKLKIFLAQNELSDAPNVFTEPFWMFLSSFELIRSEKIAFFLSLRMSCDALKWLRMSCDAPNGLI